MPSGHFFLFARSPRAILDPSVGRPPRMYLVRECGVVNAGLASRFQARAYQKPNLNPPHVNALLQVADSDEAVELTGWVSVPLR